MAVKEIRESDGQRQAGKTRLLSDAPLIAGGGDPVVPVQPYEAVEPHIRPSFWCAGYLVKKLAYEHNLAVLVMNHTGDGLGDSWKSIPHSRLFFSCDRGSNDRGCKVCDLGPALTVTDGSALPFVINDPNSVFPNCKINERRGNHCYFMKLCSELE
ncbi:hypothetical protein V6N13_144544 [Hibiscus sabdariffa]